MSYDFVILLRAEREIKKSGDWYEGRQVGLGYRFEKAVFAKITSVAINPLYYPLKGRLREAIVTDFPFLVLFRIDERNRKIVVMSVFHMRLHPNKK